jgi:hypothetical protein
MLSAAWMAAAYALPVGLLLDQLVPLLYGHQYQVSEAFCALAMFDAFLRFCRGGPNLILLHHGLTSRLTLGNLVAGIGTTVGLGLGYWTGRLEAVVVGLVVGDFISLVVLLALLRRHLALGKALFHIGVLMVTLGTAAITIWASNDLGLGMRLLIFALGAVVFCLDAAVVFMQVGREFLPRSPQPLGRNGVQAPAMPVVAVRNEPTA